MKKSALVSIGLTAILLTSCLISKKTQYARKAQFDNLVVDIDAKGTKTVAIAALDHRGHVLNNGKPRDFVGYIRAAVGIPYPIGTKSLKPLADDVASSIKETLSNRGYKCTVLATVPADQENAVIDRLKANGSEISILFLMNSWWTDTYMSTILNYDISISIYDKNGSQLSTKKFSETNKGIGATVSGFDFQTYLPDAFKKLLEKIYNDPDIKKSLQ
jgi:hypothetical protein